MRDAYAYVTLMASLPGLPPLAKLKQLPLSELRFEARLNLLDADDRPLFDALLAYLGTPKTLQPPPPSPSVPDDLADLAALATALTEARLVVAMLRRKARQQDFPTLPSAVATTFLATQIRQRWSEVTFGLDRLVPWIVPLQQALRAADARALQRQWLAVQWQILDRHQALHLFDFHAVFAYALRYQLAQQWLLLQQPAPAAATRFAQLAAYPATATPTLGGAA